MWKRNWKWDFHRAKFCRSVEYFVCVCVCGLLRCLQLPLWVLSKRRQCTKKKAPNKITKIKSPTSFARSIGRLVCERWFDNQDKSPLLFYIHRSDDLKASFNFNSFSIVHTPLRWFPFVVWLFHCWNWSIGNCKYAFDTIIHFFF